jgi:transcriptional regulator with XRE-family HTH domain
MAHTPNVVLGSNIRAEMARRGISQDALARALKRSQASISKRLRGEVSITIDDAAAIAAHLGIPLSALLDGVEITEAAS